jgi:hypothetical protein
MAEPGLVMKAKQLPPVSKAKVFVQMVEPLPDQRFIDRQIF